VPGVLVYLRNFFLKLVVIAVGLSALIVLFEFLGGGLDRSYRQLAESVFIVVGGSVVLLFIKRLRRRLSLFFGAHAATIVTFIMALVTSIVAGFAILRVYQVPADTLLLGGGVITIVVGLAVSTVVGNIISSTLMLTTYPFRVGGDVLVNNIPGTIEEVTPMFTRIRNNSGADTVIPNTAIISGGVTLTKTSIGAVVSHKLPYAVGDRIFTSYVGGEGTVVEITSFQTRVELDEGREVTIPNSSVLTGQTQIAKIKKPSKVSLRFSLKVDWDPEKAIEEMIRAAQGKSDLFMKQPEIQYASVDGNIVELSVLCEVDAKMKGEARSLLLRAAYMSRNHDSAAV
jgi:small-conductance mechanosensitive channel